MPQRRSVEIDERGAHRQRRIERLQGCAIEGELRDMRGAGRAGAGPSLKSTIRTALARSRACGRGGRCRRDHRPSRPPQDPRREGPRRASRGRTEPASSGASMTAAIRSASAIRASRRRARAMRVEIGLRCGGSADLAGRSGSLCRSAWARRPSRRAPLSPARQVGRPGGRSGARARLGRGSGAKPCGESSVGTPACPCAVVLRRQALRRSAGSSLLRPMEAGRRIIDSSRPRRTRSYQQPSARPFEFSKPATMSRCAARVIAT